MAPGALNWLDGWSLVTPPRWSPTQFWCAFGARSCASRGHPAL